MEIHKPKPIHNWRDFLKEVGIIVLGVCIALFAEQMVQTVHENSRAAKVRAAIRTEIAYNLGRMETRKATESCVSKRLDEIDALIAALAAGKLPDAPLWIGRPAAYSGNSSQFSAASGSGNASLLDNQEMATYGYVYGLLAVYAETVIDEQKAWADLRTLEDHPQPSPALDVLLRSAVKQARTARWRMEGAETLAVNGAAKLGIKPEQVPGYSMQSVCVPLHTSRAEALKLVVQGRPGHFTYDEP